LVDRFLQSIQLNPAIHAVKLLHFRISGTALASFLDAATSVTTFEIDVATWKHRNETKVRSILQHRLSETRGFEIISEQFE
jgi:hypothetical protein